jgi:hypothetical protein
MPNVNEEICEHIFVRRRDGKRCIYCNKTIFGENLTEEDHRKLQEF